MQKVSLEKYFVGLSKDSLIYGLGNAVLKILALITAPIFTRIFIPQEYGIISLVASVISLISLFLIFGMDNAIFVSFYQYKKDRSVVISSAFWFLLSWGLLVAGTLSFLTGNLSNLIFKSDSFQFLFLLSLWTAFLMLLINLAKVVFRLEFRAKTFALVTIFNAIVVTGLMVLLVVYFKKGLVGYFEGQLLGTFFSMLLALYLIRHQLKLVISYPKLKEMVLFGAMIVPSSLSFFVFDLSDRFFVNHYRNLTELGLYSIGINIASILVFFSYALGQAWSPQVMKIYFNSRKIFNQFVPRFFVYYLIFFFSLATLISLFSREILGILATSKFYDATRVIGPLSIAMVFAASNQVTSLGITLSRKTKYLALYTGIAAVINIILNFLLIPRYGMVGAGWATALSYLFLTVAYFLCSQKFIRLEIDWSKILKLVVLSLVVILCAPIFWRYGFWLNLGIKFIEISIFGALLYITDVIEKQEIDYLKIMLKKLSKRKIRKK